MIFLGTGAAELIPCPFCTCEQCTYARLHPEERRRRTSFCYDETLCFDFGPDTIVACQEFNVVLDKLQDILFTHAHDDHFSMANLNVVTMSCKKIAPFSCHMSQEAYDYLYLQRRILLDATGGKKDLFGAVEAGYYTFRPHKAFETFKMGDKTVFTVRGNHHAEAPGELSMHYRVTENGRSLLYALDGGLYAEESIEALSGTRVDVLIMDATFGSVPLPRESGHLNGEHYIEQVERLARAGVVDENTRIYAAHINPKGKWLHSQLQAYMDENCPYKVTVAHDGMQIEKP